MVTRDEPWPDGTPCWVDLGVDDLPGARRFYQGLFGWQIEDPPVEAGGYLMCLKDGRPAAGLGPKMAADQPSVWMTYLASSDVDATFAAVTEHGGRVMLAPMDVLELGRMGIAVDPAGAVFGVWQAGAMVGAGIANEPGSLIWSENMTRDWRANQDFYAAVFGYVFEDMSAPGFDYATFSTSGDPLGAVGGLPAEVPDSLAPAWFTYFAIDDADRAVDRAAALGGGIVRPPWDTPFGRLAVLSDPGGAEFSVMAVSIAEPEMVDGGD